MARSTPFNEGELEIIATVLMGAAHVDGSYDGSEQDRIAVILTSMSKSGALSRPVLERLVTFEPEGFEVGAECERLTMTPEQRREVLAAVAAVMRADGRYHVTEESYLAAVAEGLGATQEELAEVTAGLETLPAW